MAEITLACWILLLRLPEYEVLHVQEESDLSLYRFTVGPKHRVGVCPHWGARCGQVHQTRTRDGIKDLPLDKFSVEWKVRVVPDRWAHCAKVFTPAVPFLSEGAHATERFLERAAELIRTSDLANTAAFFGVPERTLTDGYDAHLQRRESTHRRPIKPIRRIGIDE